MPQVRFRFRTIAQWVLTMVLIAQTRSLQSPRLPLAQNSDWDTSSSSSSSSSIGGAAAGGRGGLGAAAGGGLLPSDLAPRRRCQLITKPICHNIGYNYTSMPNSVGHDSQEEAKLSIHLFWPLIEIGCSADLQFFLCSIYMPICMENYNKKLTACRSVCIRARSGCAPLMQQYGFSWPKEMQCDQFPEHGDPDVLCMDDNRTKSPTDKGDKSDKSSDKNKDEQAVKDKDDTEESMLEQQKLDQSVSEQPQQKQHCECKCRQPLLKVAESHALFNKVHTAGLPNCAIACSGAFFLDKDEGKKFATVWMGVWSILCAISSTLTVLTFLMDTRRFNYPERPIVMLSACYMMVSAGYIIRLAVGHEQIACDGNYLRYGSSGPWLCTLVFLLTYMFGMASCVWWVMLCVAWFLAAGLKWSSEAIAKYSEVFHCIAWFLPVAKFILVLTFSLVDGDPVSGICSVGNTDITALRVFVLLPMLTYLIVGSGFLLTGFAALFRIRSVMKQQMRAKTYKLEKLMIRIGIFSILYTLPACAVIACHFYESHLRSDWLRSKTCHCDGAQPDPEPEYGIFMLRQFMQLAVGITSGVWVWSSKTLATWRNCLGRVFCCTQPAGSSLHAYQDHQYMQAATNAAAAAAAAVAAGGGGACPGGGPGTLASSSGMVAAMHSADPRSQYKFTQVNTINQMSHV